MTRAIYPSIVSVQASEGIGLGNEVELGSPYLCYCRVGGTRSIQLGATQGSTRTDTLQLVFPAGIQYGEITAGGLASIALPVGSRIVYGGTFYSVLRVDPQVDDRTGALKEVKVYCERGGAAFEQRITAAGNYRITAAGTLRVVPRS